MKNIKVLHYVPRFSVLSETFIYDQVTSLEGLTDTRLATNQLLNVSQRPISCAFEIPLKKFVSDRVTKKLCLGFELLEYFIDYAAWRNYLSKNMPDIVHCHTGNAVKTWRHVAKKLQLENIPVVASLHGSDVTMEPLIKKGYASVLAEAARRDNIGWTVPSCFLKEKAVANLGLNKERTTVVYNGFNPFFNSELDSESIKRDGILCVGRFINCKGQEYLIRAIARLVRTAPNLKVTFVGDGPELEQCIALAEELAVSSVIKFIRAVKHSDVADLMRSHDIYVQPSIQDAETKQEEAFGVAALEALASGMKVVVTECGGLPEVVQFSPVEIKRIVPQKSPENIAEAVSELMSVDQALYARSLGVEPFSMKKNANAIFSLYNRLLK